MAILSNQAGITLNPKSTTGKSDTKRLIDFKAKANVILDALDLPITLYAATAHDQYRKPRSGMWDALLQDNGLTRETVDLEGSLFVGDAGGRVAAGRINKDFSSSDRYA